jgi:hypothetical protein
VIGVAASRHDHFRRVDGNGNARHCREGHVWSSSHGAGLEPPESLRSWIYNIVIVRRTLSGRHCSRRSRSAPDTALAYHVGARLPSLDAAERAARAETAARKREALLLARSVVVGLSAYCGSGRTREEQRALRGAENIAPYRYDFAE